MSGGERIGRYRIDGVLGVGSFATAHRGFDDRLDSDVVLKVLAENHSLNPEIRERFISEGRSLRRVRNDNVVTVYDIGETDRQQPYIVLELADRGTLAARVDDLRGRGWVPGAADVLAVARSLGRAVEAVHAANLVHRDLSPGNVLLRSKPAEMGTRGSESTLIGDDEQLLLADLGMCKDLALNSGLTVAGGTDGFRPPEQRRPGPIDTRADLWALSALMSWLSDGASLPPAFHEALNRSLADDPEERHPDVASWLADVETALAETEAPGPLLDVVEPAEPRSDRRIARRRMIVAAVVAFAVGVLATWLVTADSGPPSSADGATIGITGPDTATVGETVVFTAEVDGVRAWVWELPAGRYVTDEPTTSLTPSGPGRAVISIEATTPEGTVIEATHSFTVVDEG